MATSNYIVATAAGNRGLAMTEAKVILRQKRADVLLAYRHPWVFSKGLAGTFPYPAGTQVRVVSQDGRHLGFGFFHPVNPIALRMVTFGMEAMDESAWRARIRAALDMRRLLLPGLENYRLIHGENDGFPGLTVDRYGSLLSLQINSTGFEQIKVDLARWLAEETGATAVYECSEAHARKQEGLAPARGFLYGEERFPKTVSEDGFSYKIDPTRDQKTSLYLDQRPARAWVGTHARDKRVLDLFCYMGGFTLPALRAGAASVTSIDNSNHALEMLAENVATNHLDAQRHEVIKGDIFALLKQPPDEPFDLVILDPPSMAKSVRAQDKARKGYRNLNRMAAAWVKPGGLLLTFSCTGVIDSEVFGRSVFLGMGDARREASVVARFCAGPDHPENLAFPEGAYLKGLALYLP